MPLDKSQLETVTLNGSPTAPLNETTLPAQSNLIGQVLDERYVIEKELGHGGVGVVYLVPLYADGSFGAPTLIFPTLRTRGGDNRVMPGKLIVIRRRRTSTVTLRRSRPALAATR